MNDTIYEGMPTMSLMPIVSARFKIINDIKITLPREGNYHELGPEVFPEEAGDFNLMKDGVLYFPSITKVLLAQNKYPELKRNQIFTPYVLVINEDSVEIQGSILEILQIQAEETQPKVEETHE